MNKFKVLALFLASPVIAYAVNAPPIVKPEAMSAN
jgi:hypothetical protein